MAVQHLFRKCELNKFLILFTHIILFRNYFMIYKSYSITTYPSKTDFHFL